MVENFDIILRDLGTKAQAQLRQIVQSRGNWSICATARTTRSWTKNKDPFHGTFGVEALEPSASRLRVR